MPRHLILHIGTTKTGSTAIQDAFSRNREALRAQGIYYPVSPGRIHHNLLAFAAMKDDATRDSMESGIWNGLEPAERLARFRAEFAAEMQSLPDEIRRVVISSEFLTMMVQSEAEIRDLHAMLHPWFDSMGVVVYLRRQDAHFASLYTQMLRSGNVTPPEELRMRGRARQPLDYAALLGAWAGVFGGEAVTPRVYEHTPDRRFDAVADFAGLCGAVLPSAGGRVVESNVSMDAAGQALLAELGRRMQARDGIEDVAGRPWYTLAAAITAASPGRGWQPPRGKARSFMAQFETGNEAVRKRWFPDRARLFSDDFSALPERSEPPDDEALFEAACRTILELMRRRVAWEVKVLEVEVRRAKEAGNPKRLRSMLNRLTRLDPAHADAHAALERLDAVEWRDRARGAAASAK